MEDLLYRGIQARLAAQEAYLLANNQPPVAHTDWWKDQVAEALQEDNQSTVWPRPAVFVEFAASTASGWAGKKKISGEFTVHVVQDAAHVNSENGSASQEDFLQQLRYIDLLLDLLDGHRAGTCAATLQHTGTTRDHSQRPLLHEQLRFNYTATVSRQQIE